MKVLDSDELDVLTVDPPLLSLHVVEPFLLILSTSHAKRKCTQCKTTLIKNENMSSTRMEKLLHQCNFSTNV